MYELQANEVEPRFSEGCRVRVKIGVMDPDFPDVPLGDWTGHGFPGAQWRVCQLPGPVEPGDP